MSIVAQSPILLVDFAVEAMRGGLDRPAAAPPVTRGCARRGRAGILAARTRRPAA